MVQWLRRLSLRPQDLDSIPISHMVLTVIGNSNHGDSTSSSSSPYRHCPHMVHKHRVKQNTHLHKIKINKAFKIDDSEELWIQSVTGLKFVGDKVCGWRIFFCLFYFCMLSPCVWKRTPLTCLCVFSFHGAFGLDITISQTTPKHNKTISFTHWHLARAKINPNIKVS